MGVAAIGDWPGAGDVGPDEVSLAAWPEPPMREASTRLPEMTLPAAAAVPPIVAGLTAMADAGPCWAMAEPGAGESVPMKLPWHQLPRPGRKPRRMPEMTLPAAAAVPPIVTDEASTMTRHCGSRRGAGDVGADEVALDQVISQTLEQDPVRP